MIATAHTEAPQSFRAALVIALHRALLVVNSERVAKGKKAFPSWRELAKEHEPYADKDLTKKLDRVLKSKHDDDRMATDDALDDIVEHILQPNLKNTYPQECARLWDLYVLFGERRKRGEIAQGMLDSLLAQAKGRKIFRDLPTLTDETRTLLVTPGRWTTAERAIALLSELPGRDLRDLGIRCEAEGNIFVGEIFWIGMSDACERGDGAAASVFMKKCYHDDFSSGTLNVWLARQIAYLTFGHYFVPKYKEAWVQTLSDLLGAVDPAQSTRHFATSMKSQWPARLSCFIAKGYHRSFHLYGDDDSGEVARGLALLERSIVDFLGSDEHAIETRYWTDRHASCILALATVKLLHPNSTAEVGKLLSDALEILRDAAVTTLPLWADWYMLAGRYFKAVGLSDGNALKRASQVYGALGNESERVAQKAAAVQSVLQGTPGFHGSDKTTASGLFLFVDDEEPPCLSGGKKSKNPVERKGGRGNP